MQRALRLITLYSVLNIALPNDIRLRHKRWREKNPDKVRKWHNHWVESNRDKVRVINRRHKQKNQANILAYKRSRYKNDPEYKIVACLRANLGTQLRRHNATKRCYTVRLLGCSIESFKIYIESKFEPGMNWENYGHKVWHIDHIMPCAIFDLTKPEHQRRCFHFSNLQPMWAHENIAKSDRLFARAKDYLPL